MRVRVSEALAEADKLLETLPAGDPRRDRILAVAGLDYAPTGPNVVLPTNSLRFLDYALQTLAGAIDSADAAPTEDARAGAAKLAPDVEAAVAAWAAMK